VWRDCDCDLGYEGSRSFLSPPRLHTDGFHSSSQTSTPSSTYQSTSSLLVDRLARTITGTGGAATGCDELTQILMRKGLLSPFTFGALKLQVVGIIGWALVLVLGAAAAAEAAATTDDSLSRSRGDAAADGTLLVVIGSLPLSF
jgi:hypothetical protein